jgi:hypothetical protein
VNDVQQIVGCCVCGSNLLSRIAHRCMGCLAFFCGRCFEEHLRDNWRFIGHLYNTRRQA